MQYNMMNYYRIATFIKRFCIFVKDLPEVLDSVLDLPGIDNCHDDSVNGAVVGGFGLPRGAARCHQHVLPLIRAKHIHCDHIGGCWGGIRIDPAHQPQGQTVHIVGFLAGDDRSDDFADEHIEFTLCARRMRRAR